MDIKKRSGLARLNSLQIAGLAVLTSTVAATSVLLAVRLAMGNARTAEPDDRPAHWGDTVQETAQPVVDTEMKAEMPRHFTEDLIVPGFTETGEDVLRDDEREGRSPEGV